MEAGGKTEAAGKGPPLPLRRIAAAAAADAERISRPGGGVRSGHRYGSFSSMLLRKSLVIPSSRPRGSSWAPGRRDEGDAAAATVGGGGDGIEGRASLPLRGPLPRLRAASAATTRVEQPADVEGKAACWRRGLLLGVVDRIILTVFAPRVCGPNLVSSARHEHFSLFGWANSTLSVSLHLWIASGWR